VAAPGTEKDAKKPKAPAQKLSASSAPAPGRSDDADQAGPPPVSMSLLPIEVLAAAAEFSPGDCASLVDTVLPAVAVITCASQAPADPALYEALQVRSDTVVSWCG
jgi:hypothetical protein